MADNRNSRPPNFLVISRVMFCVLVQQARTGCANFRRTHSYQLATTKTHFHVGVLAHHVIRHAIDSLPYPRFVCVGHPHPPRSSITRQSFELSLRRVDCVFELLELQGETRVMGRCIGVNWVTLGR